MPNPPSPPSASKMLTTTEAAARAEVTVKTILRWISRGLVRARREGFGKTARYLIYRDSFEKLLAKRELNTDLDE